MRHIIIISTILISTAFLSFGQMKPDWTFREEYIEGLLNIRDTIYIQDRHKLEKFTGLKCTDTTATINYTAKSDDKFVINIKKGKFEPTKHKLHLSDTVYKYIHNENRVDYTIAKYLIDGNRAYGIDSNSPRTEIKELKIKWNEKWLSIPDSAFSNLFEVHLCLDYLPIETYITKDNKFIYLYASASDGAGSFSVKFVFNKKGFVTRIVNTNECTDGYQFLDALPKDCE